ncbi:regulator of sigma E protease [Halanaerobium congolense]|jgi:regulator of sigma E protease|uniref:Zinc metalloprotease n=1 Tax=Halanaerobium congolense TaxID=54121 RepID=A0A1M7GTT5_9FIRM|nr:RIP metalloprotease RseP [Halanaerobium congolense]PTX17104.1 regulator of sigma E protease [Halanaerobium congolense]PXV69318.1 regulator of sigma E protease [Halanaerobium congolense]SDE70901.1 regulator of sigma E protease [Halanaerobium congolense]SDI47899.1 regulator of sigma E protease [Halanaerobium congolense]SES61729.1 regulator of sigma E protease [Halanaerobium congolense]
MVLTIVSFIVVLGVLVFIHEFGHYITAKKSDIMVSEFALGFGPKLLSKQVGETLYSIRAIPLGGFCNMVGEFPPDDSMPAEEREIYDKAKAKGRLFNQKSPLKRLAVILMGPIMNFLLAVLIFISAFAIFGVPTSTNEAAILGEVIPEQPAAEAGLRANDKILSINGQEVNNWNEMSELIRENSEQKISIRYQRNNQIKEITVTPMYSEESERGVIGVYPKLIREDVSLFSALTLGLEQSYRVFKMTILGFVQMFRESSAEDIGGPIMIASIIGQAARVGILNVLNWMAIISINLGIINLLPFPALDGGRILFIVVELIRGQPVDPRKESYVHMLGFAILMLLMVFIIYNDVMRTFFN